MSSIEQHRIGQHISMFFFSIEMNIHTINIKTAVTWHHDYYECQGYKKSNS